MNETTPLPTVPTSTSSALDDQKKLADAWEQIHALRKRLDIQDTAAAVILCERFEIVSAIGQIKKEHGIEVKDPIREAAQLARLGEIAVKNDVPREYMTSMFQMILRVSRIVQRGKPDPNVPIEPRICSFCGIRSCGDPSPNLACRCCPSCKQPLIF